MKRRDLLKASLLGASGFMLSGSANQSRGDEAAKELKLGLIGVGTQGRELIRAALLDKHVRFVAVCDIWEYARRYGQYYLKNYGHQVTTYADYAEMIEKEPSLDAVVVASPDRVHAEQTLACLEADLHVYCETPMASTVEGARSMVRAAAATDRLVQIGYQRRSNPRYRHVRQQLINEAKLLGRVVQANTAWRFAVDSDRGWPRRQEISNEVLLEHGYEDMQQFRNWRWHREHSGGLFANLSAHQVDVLLWMLEAQPASVAALGEPAQGKVDLWPGNVTAWYRLSTDAGIVPACCQMLTATRGDGSGSHETLLGSEGTIRNSQNPKQAAVYRDPGAPDWDDWVRRGWLSQGESQRLSRAERGQSEVSETGEIVPYEIPLSLDRPHCYPHLENFFNAIRSQIPLNCPAETALATEVAVHGVSQALNTGGVIELSSA